MATAKREKSESGFYHVMQRGVNLLDIFEDDDDREHYLHLLEKTSRNCGVEIHAWCLIGNHTHLLLKDEDDELPNMMRNLGSQYARYFNRRHDRTGSLFGGRYESRCVDDDPRYIAVVRYIHRNPITHEEGTLSGDYQWTSYREYVNGVTDFCKTDLALALFGGISEFKRMHEEEWPYERHLDIGTSKAPCDEEVRVLANGVLEEAGFSVDVSHIGRLKRGMRDKALFVVKRVVGCPMRQIQRLTAVPYSAIRKAVSTLAGEADGAEERELKPTEELLTSLANPEMAREGAWLTERVGLLNARLLKASVAFT